MRRVSMSSYLLAVAESRFFLCDFFAFCEEVTEEESIFDPGSSNHARWAYRLIGPFIIPDYAGGGYASALSVRLFADVLGRHDSVRLAKALH